MKSKNIYKILDLLTSNGITLFVDEDHLKIKKRTNNFLSNELLELIKSNKTDLITYLKSQKKAVNKAVKTAGDYGLPTSISNKCLKSFIDLPIHQDRVTNLYPLTPLQKGFLFHELYAEKSAYTCQFYCDLKGGLDKEILVQCWNYLMQKHTVLRTTIFGEDLDVPVQCVYDQVELPLEVLDFSQLSNESAASAFDEFMSKDMGSGFNLKEAPLFRLTLINLGDEGFRFVFTHHHIILDGWSVQNLMRDFHFLYGHFSSKGVFPELTLDDFNGHLRTTSAVNEAEGLSFWKTYLTPLTAASYLPFVKDSALRNKVFGNKKLEFSVEGDIKAFTKKHHISENTLFQGAWSYLLSKYTGNSAVSFGVITSGRDVKANDVEAKAGLYMNTIPLCTELNEENTVAEWLQELQRGHNTAREEYGSLSLSNVEKESTVNGALFDTIVSFQNYLDSSKEPSSKNNTLLIENIKGDTHTNYACTLDVYSMPNELKVVVQYNDKLLSEETINNIKGHLEKVIESLLSGVEKIKDLSYLSSREEDLLINEFNDTKQEFENDKTVLDLFSESAYRNPAQQAVIYENQQLTYKELDEKSTLWAKKLVKAGVQEGSVVMLRMTKSTEIITAILSTLKSGASYMFVDQNLPNERVLHMLEETDCKHCITNLKEQIPAMKNCWVSDVDGLEKSSFEDDDIVLPRISTNHLAYILYTSGSTGKPKACMISHANLFNFISWGNEFYYGNQQEGNWGLISSLSFDLSVTVIFTALTRGKKLFIGSESKDMDQLLLDCFNNPEIDTLMLTPSHVTIMKDLAIKNAGVKTFICGGEQLKKSHIETIKHIDEKIRIINEYGPTETTVACTAIEIKGVEDKITIGRPIANTEILILDNQHKVVPVGVVGELYISGAGVSNGYLKNEALTVEKFVSIHNRVFYKTGDLGRWDSNGRIEYSGRADDQVKVRGYRIQLKEIETVLDSLDGIKQSLVIAREDHSNSKQLVGYFVSEKPVGDELIKEYLDKKLPNYMVPNVYVHLPFFPTTMAGKIDFKALPVPENSNNYQPPRTKLEKQLVDVWQKLLGIEQVGIHDNFYEIGGDSIKAIQLVSRCKSFGVHFQVKDIFNYQTIAEILSHLKDKESIQQETGVLAGEVPLHPIQKIFFERGYENINHSNQSVLLKISKEITAETLTFSLNELAKQHDVLRLTYEFKGNNRYPEQSYSHTVPQLHLNEVEKLEEVTEICNRYQSSFNIYKGDLVRFVLFKTSEQESDNRLFITIHHLAVDGVSWRILTEDLKNLLESHHKGESKSLPVKATSYRQWVQRLNSYAGTAGLEKEYKYWKEVVSNFSPLPVDNYYNEPISYYETQNLRVSLSPELTHTLIHESHKMFGTEINDILISALTITLAGWVNAPKVVIALEGHGREEIFDDVDINRTMGWFTSVYPVCLNTDDISDIDMLVADTKDMLRRVPNRGIGYNVLRFESASEKITSDLSTFYEELTFNYLGTFDNSLDAKTENVIGLTSESTGLNVAKENVNPHRISIDSVITDGILHLDWNYDAIRYNQETIQSLANSYIKALETIFSFHSGLSDQEEYAMEEDYNISLL